MLKPIPITRDTIAAFVAGVAVTVLAAFLGSLIS